MGSFIIANDTLQITNEQGFPQELDFEKHKDKPFVVEDFSGKIFDFYNKESIRVYHAPPVRNFLVQNINGKWLYWGLIHIIEVVHDNAKQITSGKFKIEYIYTPEEMKKAHELIDRNPKTDYFS